MQGAVLRCHNFVVDRGRLVVSRYQSRRSRINGREAILFRLRRRRVSLYGVRRRTHGGRECLVCSRHHLGCDYRAVGKRLIALVGGVQRVEYGGRLLNGTVLLCRYVNNFLDAAGQRLHPSGKLRLRIRLGLKLGYCGLNRSRKCAPDPRQFGYHICERRDYTLYFKDRGIEAVESRNRIQERLLQLHADSLGRDVCRILDRFEGITGGGRTACERG